MTNINEIKQIVQKTSKLLSAYALESDADLETRNDSFEQIKKNLADIIDEMDTQGVADELGVDDSDVINTILDNILFLSELQLEQQKKLDEITNRLKEDKPLLTMGSEITVETIARIGRMAHHFAVVAHERSAHFNPILIDSKMLRDSSFGFEVLDPMDKREINKVVLDSTFVINAPMLEGITANCLADIPPKSPDKDNWRDNEKNYGQKNKSFGNIKNYNTRMR